jgi:hypothetical protein
MVHDGSRPERPPCRILWTAVRALGCLALFAAFLSGGSRLTVGITDIAAMLTAAAVLAAYELSIREVAMEWILAVVLVLLWGGGLGYAAWHFTRPPAPTGPLLPANEPTPSTACRTPVGPHDLVMIAAESRLVGKGPGPFQVLAVGDCPVLNLRRAGKGLMADATFYDWTDDIAFRVAANVYEPLMPLQLTAFRPDPHTLVILDRFDQEVLYLRFLNPHAVRIRGRFLCGERPQAVVRDRALLMGGMRVGGVYLGQRPDRHTVCAIAAPDRPGLVLGAQ